MLYVILVLVLLLCQKSLYDMLELKPLDDSILGVYLIDSTVKRPLGRIDDVLIIANDDYVPIDFSCFGY